MEAQRLKYLLDRYTGYMATPAEMQELNRLDLNLEENRCLLEKVIADQIANHDEPTFDSSPYKDLAILAVEADRCKFSVDRSSDALVRRLYPRRRRQLWRAVAAALIIIAGTGLLLWNLSTDQKKLAEKSSTINASPDIGPGKQKAMLTLTDGRKILLDSVANGRVASVDGAEIIKKEGELIYQPGQFSKNGSHNADHPVAYNTMSTPRGGYYHLTLSDGTKVWLNASSSITYPTKFTNEQRLVKVEGEVYFEVAPNKTQPFIVESIQGQITVLGTAFNVNVYRDEPYAKTTLAEGKIKINNQLILPGQAFVQGRIVKTNVAKDIAWKNGQFFFEDTPLEDVMRQISKWYDIDVRYEAKVPDIHFSGEMSKKEKLSMVLGFLKQSGVSLEVTKDLKSIIIHHK